MEFYPDASEEIPRDLPPEKWSRVRMTITEILVMLNNTPIRWISMRQKTVETSTYGSKLEASRVDTELILDIRYMLWSLGVALDGPSLMLGDFTSVVLKKKHI
jgi:hypothetical protein